MCIYKYAYDMLPLGSMYQLGNYENGLGQVLLIEVLE